jgi:hypothetical protein
MCLPAGDAGWMRLGMKKTRQNNEIGREKFLQSWPTTPIPSI